MMNRQMKFLMVGTVLAASLSVSGAAFAEVDHSADSYFGHTRHDGVLIVPVPPSQVTPAESEIVATPDVQPVVQSEIPYTSAAYGSTANNKK